MSTEVTTHTQNTHTHTSCSKSIQVPLGQPLALCGLDIHILLCYILQPQQRSRRDWMLPSLCQKAAVSSTIFFPKIRVAREMRSHRQSGEGWMTQLVSSSVSWLLSTFSDCVTTPAVESTLFITLNVSFMTDVNQFKSLPQTHYKPSAESFKYTPFFLQHKVLRIQCGGVSFFDSLPLPTYETLSKSLGRSKYARPSNFCGFYAVISLGTQAQLTPQKSDSKGSKWKM